MCLFAKNKLSTNCGMRKLVYIFLALLVIGCSSQSAEEKAAEAAKTYYENLAKDFPEGFLEGKLGVDSLPAEYCEQLLDVYRQYVSEVEEKHGGIRSVSVSANVGRRDTILNVVYAFLLLSFNDSTQEEILVPMVEQNGRWLMK